MALYLIPTPLADDTAAQVLPPQVVAAVARLPYFLVENARTARRFVKSVAPARTIEDIRFGVIDKDSTPAEVRAALAPLLQEGLDAGVLSEAGCPGIADPGAALAAEAHRLGLPVVPLVGPSSLLLALMASGLNGQQFAVSRLLAHREGPRATAIARPWSARPSSAIRASCSSKRPTETGPCSWTCWRICSLPRLCVAAGRDGCGRVHPHAAGERMAAAARAGTAQDSDRICTRSINTY
ncbi:MAG: SAM-dependent methyltransferase [Hymenobacter sp.]